MPNKIKSELVALCIKMTGDDKEAAVKAQAQRVLQKMIMNQGVAEEARGCVPIVTKMLEHKDPKVHNVCNPSFVVLDLVVIGESRLLRDARIRDLEPGWQGVVH